MSPSWKQSTEGLPFQVDQFLGSRPTLDSLSVRIPDLDLELVRPSGAQVVQQGLRALALELVQTRAPSIQDGLEHGNVL
jgi:hypothetical protein